MSRDSSRTYIHLQRPNHADLFDDFTSPTNTTGQSSPSHNKQNAASTIPWSTSTTPSTLLAPLPLGNTTHIPHEDILIPLHLLPPNPEDEDDIVPDQHAAFGITRALAARERERESRWRDFGSLTERVTGVDLFRQTNGGAADGSALSITASAREGRNLPR